MASAEIKQIGMTNDELMTTSPLPDEIASALARLRWQVRAYVVVEGLALAIVWLGSMFWAGLALDYLPVRLGAAEMPHTARLILLIAVGTVLALIVYHWVLRRAFVRLANRSLAVLLERQFDRFHDSLLTSVELTERPDQAGDFSGEMLVRTREAARDQIADVSVPRVFNFFPLIRNAIAASVLLLSIVVFHHFASDAFAIATSRLYGLSDEAWPRKSRIEVVGFHDGRIKVARGSDFSIVVLADTRYKVPELCTIYYRTAEGERGPVNMQKVGAAEAGQQKYTYSGKPFKGIISTVKFDVVGYDHRVRDHEVEVVESPQLTETFLDCEFPQYLVDEALGIYLPRTVKLTPGTRLPRGTQVRIRAGANKDLEAVELFDVNSQELTRIDISGEAESPRRFEHTIESLDDTMTLEVSLYDTDGVVSETPFRLTIVAVPDKSPVVDVAIRGIGTAITAEARLPFEGNITDDNALARAWFEVDHGADESRIFEILLDESAAQQPALDLREERSRDADPFEVKPGQTITVAVAAADRHDLTGGPHTGTSDRYQLEVVEPDRLLALLEARELSLRRRFEQVIDEMTETRDTLVRVKTFDGAAGGDEPEDNTQQAGEPEADSSGDAEVSADRAVEEGTDAANTANDENRLAHDRAQSLRLLRVQRSAQNVHRSAREVYDVGASFDDICLELINNRVDSEERKTRLKEQIASPLQQIANNMYPELQGKLQELERQLDDPAVGGTVAAQAVDKADEILVALDDILQRMLDLETFNELIDIVRSLIDDQQGLIDETKKQQALDLLN